MRNMIKKFILLNVVIIIGSLTVLSQSEQLIVNLSPTANKQVLTFENPKGSIKATGYDGNNIVINAYLRVHEAEKQAQKSVTRIGRNSFDIYAETNGNNVNLFCREVDKTVDVDIKLPKNFSLKLRSLDNGTVQVINVNGDIEVDNANGDIILENISGSASLNSVYGKIIATFREVRPDCPMMFTSLEGDISINLPAGLNAVLKMKTGSGEIYSDFDLPHAKVQPDVNNTENNKVSSLEDWILEKINSGGPEYVIRSYSGKIFIKKNRISRNF